mmetsp:Transcript_24415/g.44159  ORF Transcript_24415/g.44159 Transcript_24415/m.44159 type:complete len:85 (+) Transcript_24415:296-550(+)
MHTVYIQISLALFVSLSISLVFEYGFRRCHVVEAQEKNPSDCEAGTCHPATNGIAIRDFVEIENAPHATNEHGTLGHAISNPLS